MAHVVHHRWGERMMNTMVSLRISIALALGLAAAPLAIGCAAPTEDEAVEEGGNAYSSPDSPRTDALFVKAERLAVRHASGDMCDDATSFEILSLLREATALDTSRGFKEKIDASDKLQTAVGRLLDFHQIVGRVRSEDSRVLGIEAASERGFVVFGPAPGVYGNMAKLWIEKDGQASLETMYINYEGDPEWSALLTTWTLNERSDGTYLSIGTNAGDKTFRIQLDAERGEFVFSPEDGDELPFSSLPSECEA
jgi:hypothetical protein